MITRKQTKEKPSEFMEQLARVEAVREYMDSRGFTGAGDRLSDCIAWIKDAYDKDGRRHF